MGDQEDLLGQMSSQLSELAATPHRSSIGQPGVSSPPPAGQRTQYGYVPSDEGRTSVRRLSSLNLSASIPLSSSSSPEAGHGLFSSLQSVGHDDNLAHVGYDDDRFTQTDVPWLREQHFRFSPSGNSAVDSPRQRAHIFDDHDSQINQRRLEPIDNNIFNYDRISFMNGRPVEDYSTPPLAVNQLVSSGMQYKASESSLPDVSSHNPHAAIHNPHATIYNPHATLRNPHASTDSLYLKSEHMYQSSDAVISSFPEDLWPYNPAYEAMPVGYHPDVTHLFTSSTASSPARPISGDIQTGSHLSPKSSQAELNNLDVYGKISLDLGTAVGGSGRWSFDSYSLNSKVNRCNSETDLRHGSFFDSGVLSSLNNLNSRSSPVRPSSFLAPRPSYSDIAKTPTTRAKFEARIAPPNVKISCGSASVKSLKQDRKLLRPAVKRTLSGPNFLPRTSQGVDVAISQVAPSSRYGLDNFDEQMDDEKSHRSSSSGSADHMTASNNCGNSSEGTHDISPPDTRHVKIQEDGNQRSQVSRNSTTTKLVTTGGGSVPSSDKPGLRRKMFKDHSQDVTDNSTGIRQTNMDDHVPVAATSNDTVLNNGKPAVSKNTSKLLSSTHQPDYINNNLRDISKLTNQTAAKAGQCLGSCKLEDQYKQRESKTGKRYGTQSSGSCHDRSKGRNSSSKNHAGLHETPDTWRRQRLLPALDTDRFDAWCAAVVEKLMQYWNLSLTSMYNIATYTLGIILHLSSSVVQMFLLLVTCALTNIKERFFKSYLGTETGKAHHGNARKRIGLEDNIILPATGEEAIKRLLSCKGKDPYSILGLRTDTSDEDIKKYYRKQAVLVHPDKNQEPGAEDAFKILGHAFKMIGDPVKRKQYDGHTQEAQELQAMRKFAEMLSKLQTKIQEAANMMYCDVCGGKHRRVPVDRPFYSARFCQQCNARHSAKAGDIWAESTMLGFYWHYFALLDGHVFDITDWMKCHKEYFKHMKANSHTVTYKLATDGSSRHHNTGGAKLQDFMNCLFKASSSTAQGHNPSWNSARADKWTQAAGSSSAASKTTHHKKRHL